MLPQDRSRSQSGARDVAQAGVGRIAACLGLSVLFHALALFASANGGWVHTTAETGAFVPLNVVMRPHSLAEMEPSDAVSQRASEPSVAIESQDTVRYNKVAEDRPSGALAISSESGPDSDKPIPLAQKYYRVSELTQKPRILVEPEFSYPAGREQNQAGVVRLALFIGDDGAVDSVEVKRDASTLSEIFQDSASQAFALSRFVPGEIDGTPVRSILQVEISFEAGPDQAAGSQDFASRH